MNDIAIHVENLGKLYHLGKAQQRHDTLRDALVAGLRTPVNWLRRDGRGADEQETILWALKDVSFEVERGKALGVIGRNGAGKSTLLKILSRITEPTTGRAKIMGRVGSLLEVGTGFHPELTGRENIYLNGAILGMRRVEIDRKFDEIVTFAEIERFLDTPVKRYSSGMYVRLAFAVAAHLEPEILLVDEVLAVGDVAFQKKCLGKMDDVAHQGRTVLFVSHNMSAIQRLCSQSLMLEHGRLVAYGNSADVVAQYLSASSYAASPGEWIDVTDADRTGTGEARVDQVWYSSPNEGMGFKPYSNGPLEFALKIVSDAPRSVGSIAVTLYDQYGTKLVNADTRSLGQSVALQEGHNVVRFKLEKLHLNQGVYVLGLWLANPTGGTFDYVKAALKLEVISLESEAFEYGTKVKVDGLVVCNFEISVD